MLSSDILEQQFGPTELVIVSQNKKHRIIRTIATQSHAVLELSIVTFDTINTTLFPEIHKQILQGSSMGKAFKDAGIKFVRDVHFVTRSVIPANIQTIFASQDSATIIDVDILIGPDKTHYCHITEIYNPIVSWPKSDKPQSPNVEQTLSQISKMLK